MSIPVPSIASSTAALGSALPSRNRRAIIAIMGRMINANVNTAFGLVLAEAGCPGLSLLLVSRCFFRLCELLGLKFDLNVS